LISDVDEQDGAGCALPKILVVEDEALIAMELGERLRDMGYVVIGPAQAIAEAEALIARERPDAALLDANLAGQSSLPLGLALAARGVPVAFYTGYEQLKDLPAELAMAPVLTKPISDDELGATLAGLLA
jgi:DNA-binding response OmpR family regulator